MALPPELRNSVYSMLLAGSTPSLSVLSVNKLLHEEAVSYFYQHNAFTIDLGGRGEIPTATILPPIPDRYIRYLRHLTVTIRLGTSTALHMDCARRIEALSRSGVRLASLTVKLASDTSRFLAPRVDDTVLAAPHPLTRALHHLLVSSTTTSTCIALDSVWFAPSLAAALQSEFEGRLDIVSSSPASAVERELRGFEAHSHLHALGLDGDEAQQNPRWCVSLDSPAEVGSALSDLDQFSPMEFFESLAEGEGEGVEGEEGDVCTYAGKMERVDSVFDGLGLDEGWDSEENEELLTEEDDVEDEEMMDVDDLEAILESLEEEAQYKACEMDVCYMTNFAPEMLGRWAEELA